jgi:hypothetical protein
LLVVNGDGRSTVRGKLTVRKFYERYRKRGERTLIELKLNHPEQLFNSLDPSPFLEKDLDDAADAYILDSARELPLPTPLELVVYLPPAELRHGLEAEISQALHSHYAYKAQLAGSDLREVFREGRIALLIGVIFLLACNLARELLLSWPYPTAAEMLREGLLIIGWVAMWRPTEILLYEWWPVRHRQRLYTKLSKLPLSLRPAAGKPGAAIQAAT